eukprot:11813920-Karenia_brevis.AAC.1
MAQELGQRLDQVINPVGLHQNSSKATSVTALFGPGSHKTFKAMIRENSQGLAPHTRYLGP